MSRANKSKSMIKIAHAVIDQDLQTLSPHLLLEHLEGVAHLTGKYAEVFSNADWGRVAGILHDLGKGSAEFQDYIRKVTGYEIEEDITNIPGRGPNHSSHGATWVAENWQGLTGKVLAYLIAGHHAGLPDWHSEIGGGGSLDSRLSKGEISKLPELSPSWRQEVTSNLCSPSTPPCNQQMKEPDSFHLWVRMLFSCLVDADYLDTEVFMDKQKAAHRNGYQTLSETKEIFKELIGKFNSFMNQLVSMADETEVNILRQQILAECRKAAERESGFFSLTVPTGGGKTLSGMAFALEHALKHNKSRIIIAIPYTSIIEQTAEEYKKIFGSDNVLEHHSNLDPDKETLQARLACENWDKPLIVTTNVQLFESLFAAKSSRCRKLHNIVNSVIICDEAQMLPPEYLKPILSAMQGLVDYFKVSIVLCTATQPALTGEIGSSGAKFNGIDPGHVREIISAPELLSHKFQRIFVKQAGKYEQWQDLVDDLINYPQVLCVVNTRKDCQDLHALMPQNSILLSANLCGEHRSEIIAQIKASLKNNEPIRVISTQLVEAGVDIDFPVVYRAMAGFDSIAQAAGRCNREGRLMKNGKKVKGQVVVFEPPKLAPPGYLRKGADAGAEIMRLDPDGCRNLIPATFRRYFELFYGNGVASFDQKNMQNLLVDGAWSGELQFRTAARKFCLIDDQDQVGVVVWHEGRKTSGRQLIDQLKRYGPSRKLLRGMQRFTVTIPKQKLPENRDNDVLEEISGIWCQAVDYAYDDTLGFVGLDMQPDGGAIFVDDI